MNKISSKDASALLKQAAVAIRHVTSKNQELETELGSLKEAQRLEALARDMEEKGLSQDLTFEEKVASLKRDGVNLDVAEEAIKMAAPQGNFLGDPDGDDAPGGAGQSALESYILTGEAPA